MARNIEIKARVGSLVEVAKRAASIADQGPIELYQDDTFFASPNGRLKLRTFPDNQGDLIFYQRSDATGPKTSHYFISKTVEADRLGQVMSLALPVVGRVRKQRTLYLVGRTRVHLDRVEGLGEFVELEVVLADGESADIGTAQAHALLEQLGITQQQLVAGAYVDLKR
jgi:predicted adenylyl cyclase CyaB